MNRRECRQVRIRVVADSSPACPPVAALRGYRHLSDSASMTARISVVRSMAQRLPHWPTGQSAHSPVTRGRAQLQLLEPVRSRDRIGAARLSNEISRGVVHSRPTMKMQTRNSSLVLWEATVAGAYR